MKRSVLIILSLIILNLFFSQTILSQTIDCTSVNEGQRIGPYVCRNGKWEYDSQ